MAAPCAPPSALAPLLQAGVDPAPATLLLEGAASLVQEAAGGQRITLVVDDSTGPLIGSTDSFFQLPQIPVVSVSAVDVDGTAVAAGTEGYKLIGNRLW